MNNTSPPLFFMSLLAAFIILQPNPHALAEESGTFTGTWVANGTQEALPFIEGRKIALIRLSGHVNLKDPIGKESDYWSQCIGLTDSALGSDIRCTWHNPDGQKIYLALKGKQMADGSLVTGDIIGGTDAAKGITGSLSFSWSSMSLQQDQGTVAVGGYANKLSGSYTLP